MRTAFTSEIRGFIVNNFLLGKGDTLTNDSSFLDLGIIDSTGMLELVLYLENTYKITIADDELIPANLDSINRIADYLARKRSAQTLETLAVRPEVFSNDLSR